MDVGLDPGLRSHVVGALGEHLARIGQARHEDVDFARLAGVGVEHLHGVADVVDLHLLGGFALDAHGDLVGGRPGAVLLAEGGVQVGFHARCQGVLAVLPPKRQHGHAGTVHLLVDAGMVDLRLRHIGSLLCRIDDGSNRRIVHLLRQGPLEAVRLRAGGHRPYRCGGAPARERCVPDTHPHRPLPKYFSVLDHFFFLSRNGPMGTFVPIGIVAEKEAPLSGRVAI